MAAREVLVFASPGSNPGLPASKKCPRCGFYKPQIDYYISTRSKDGLQGYCKRCSSQKRAEHQHAVRTAVRLKWLEKQNYKCAACQEPVTLETGHLDHRHGHCNNKRGCKGCQRGFLCIRCNFMAGWLETGLGDVVQAYLDRTGGI